MLKRLFLLAVLLISASGARAAILATLSNVNANGSLFDWVYDIKLEPGAVMQEQDFFTIYDFVGSPGVTDANFVPSADSAVAGHTFGVTSLLSGVTPTGVLPSDNPSIPNVTVALTGGGTIAPGNLAIDLGKLTVQSSLGEEATTRINFTSFTHIPAGLNRFEEHAVLGTVDGPAPVPEPETYALMGIGLLALAGTARRRIRKS